MFSDNLTRDEAQARARLVATHTYQVFVDLSGAGVEDPATQFRSRSTIRFTARADGALHLDLIADAVLSASLDGATLDPASFADSRLPLTVTAGDHELSVEAVCRFSRSGEGLHRFVDPADGRTYLYTQFEAADARRMYGCFEQPDLKARFTTPALAPRGWTVISNGGPVETSEEEPGLRRTRFAETLPISTYLTALVAGDYVSIPHSYEAAGGPVEMAVVCRQSLVEHLDHQEIVDITTGGFKVFEGHFEFPYPFGKYDQVFVPEYNGGAMENVGCVTLRDEYIFRSRATQAVTNFRRDTILHELSHMWFGDLVTMRWWDDLWLKESFATWASNFATSEQAEDPSLAWAGFCSGSKTLAYRQDQLPSTHPIAADIVDLEAVEYNFDQITYAKGASVLVQLVAFVGRDAFLAGLRGYFATHAYGNTGLGDLLASLQTASGRDLSDWSAQWLETAGVNTLRVELSAVEGVVTAATVHQGAPADWPTLRDHRVAFGVYELTDDDRLVRTDRIECDVTGPQTDLPQLVGRAVPAVLLPNDDDLTYAKVRLDQRSLDNVLTALPTIDNALSRAVLWGSLWDACRDAELDPTAFVDLVLAAVPHETGPTAVRNALAQAGTASWSYTPPAQRAGVRARWEAGVQSLLDRAEPASDQQLALARSYAAAANPGPGADRLAGWLRDEGVPEGLLIDTDLRWSVVNNLARLGQLDEAQIDAERRRDDSITGSEQAAGARAARPTAEAKAEAWRLAVESSDVPNATHTAICLNFWSLGHDELLLPYVDRYFAVAQDISAGRHGWARKGLSLQKNVLRLLFPWPSDQKDFLVRLDTWLETAELSSSARRVIAERRDDTLRSLRCQDAAAL